MDPVERRNYVNRARLCVNCLARSHQREACPSTKRCRLCSYDHHTMLHRPETVDNSSDTETTEGGSTPEHVSPRSLHVPDSPRASPRSWRVPDSPRASPRSLHVPDSPPPPLLRLPRFDGVLQNATTQTDPPEQADAFSQAAMAPPQRNIGVQVARRHDRVAACLSRIVEAVAELNTLLQQ